MVRRVALVATILAAVWTAVLVFFGGFDVTIAGVTVTSHAPLRPLIFGTLAFAAFAWANGLDRTVNTLSRAFARLDHRLIAASLAIWVVGTGLTRGTTAGFGADSYGYVSQADLWLDGQLKQREPWAELAPWPRAPWTFSPLGYRPALDDENRGELIPTYSPGLPMLMALTKRIAGHCAMFWIVPLSGGLLVWTTYWLGRRFGAPWAGAIAAWLVATSPAMLLALMRPMTDVPVAAIWTGALVMALARGYGSAFAAGLLAGFATLVRPNLAPLAGVLGLSYVLRTPPQGASMTSRLAALAFFAAGLAPGVVATAVIFNFLYGSPFISGYGGFSQQFAWRNVFQNVVNYLSWLIDTQSVFILAGIAVLVVPLRRVWPGVTDRRLIFVVGLFSAVLWAQFCFYLVFEDWAYLRFLLPFWPIVMLGLGAVAMVGLRARQPLIILAAGWLVLALGVRGRAITEERNLLDLWPGDSVSVGAARAVQSVTEPNSVVLTLLHSGTVRYYGGRITLRYDILDRDWLDKAVAWFAERGVAVYALLDDSSIDQYRSEVEYFTQRFAGQHTVDRLKTSLVFTYAGPRPVYLYALSAPPPLVREPDPAFADPAHLSCAPPAPRGQLTLK